MTIEVYLTPEELRRAADVGNLRQEHSARRKARFDQKTTPRAHVVGAMGELAFCKGLGFEWMGYVDTFKTVPDVAPFWEVRATTSLFNLPVKPVWTDEGGGDHPYEQVAFVLASPPDFKILGFITAGWAQQNLPAVDRPDRDGNPRDRPAHWVTEYMLTPINEGFHTTCGWINGYSDRQGWLCLYCGKEYGDVSKPNGGA